jgi:hypothetical protein
VDYEKKYEEDAYGQEWGPTARVWRAYMSEAELFDVELSGEWKDTVDVLLVFAGLFSAISATFLAISVISLQPDYAQITVSLLLEQIAIQRAIAAGQTADSVPPSALNLENFPLPSTGDRWVNGLWFTSLTFSLFTAFVAVILKQWIHQYRFFVSGTPQEQALHRHFRYMGLKKWGVPIIIGFLPILLHISLFLYLVGLVVFLVPLDQVIGTITLVLTGFSATFYLVTNILPVVFPECPYQTPISNYIYVMLDLAWRVILFISFFPKYLRIRSRWPFIRRSAPLPTRLVHKSTARDRENDAIIRSSDHLAANAVIWLYSASSNPSVRAIALESISGLPAWFDPKQRGHLRDHMDFELRRSFRACFKELPNDVFRLKEKSPTPVVERLGRGLVQLGPWVDSTSLTSSRHAPVVKRLQSLVEESQEGDSINPELHSLGFCAFSNQNWQQTQSPIIPPDRLAHRQILEVLRDNPNTHPAVWVSLLCFGVRKIQNDILDDSFEIDELVLDLFSLIPAPICSSDKDSSLRSVKWSVLIQYLVSLLVHLLHGPQVHEVKFLLVELEREEMIGSQRRQRLTITLFCYLCIIVLDHLDESRINELFGSNRHFARLSSEWLRAPSQVVIEDSKAPSLDNMAYILRRVSNMAVNLRPSVCSTDAFLSIYTFTHRSILCLEKQDASMYLKVLEKIEDSHAALARLPSPQQSRVMQLWAVYLDAILTGNSDYNNAALEEVTKRRNLLSLLQILFTCHGRHRKLQTTFFARQLLRLAKYYHPLEPAWKEALEDLLHNSSSHTEVRYASHVTAGHLYIVGLIEELRRFAGYAWSVDSNEDEAVLDLHVYEKVGQPPTEVKEDEQVTLQSSEKLEIINGEKWIIRPLTNTLRGVFPTDDAYLTTSMPSGTLRDRVLFWRDLQTSPA